MNQEDLTMPVHKGAIFQAEDGSNVYVLFNDPHNKQLLLGDGLKSFILPYSLAFEIYKPINNELGRQNFTSACLVRIGEDESAQQVDQKYEMFIQQAIEITRSQMTPFTKCSQTLTGAVQIKEQKTYLSDAIGFWKMANVILDTHQGEDDERPIPFFRINLVGEIFRSRIDFSEEDHIEPTPRFRLALDEEQSPLRISMGEDYENEQMVIDFDLSVRDAVALGGNDGEEQAQSG